MKKFDFENLRSGRRFHCLQRTNKSATGQTLTILYFNSVNFIIDLQDWQKTKKLKFLSRQFYFEIAAASPSQILKSTVADYTVG